jgi:hypothetical protein
VAADCAAQNHQRDPMGQGFEGDSEFYPTFAPPLVWDEWLKANMLAVRQLPKTFYT